MTVLYTMEEAAAKLRMCRRSLQVWLDDQPSDSAGVPFYVPNGNRKLFSDADLSRITLAKREEEARRLRKEKKCRGSLYHLAQEKPSPTAPAGNTAAFELTTALELATKTRRNGYLGLGKNKPSSASSSHPKKPTAREKLTLVR